VILDIESTGARLLAAALRPGVPPRCSSSGAGNEVRLCPPTSLPRQLCATADAIAAHWRCGLCPVGSQAQSAGPFPGSTPRAGRSSSSANKDLTDGLLARRVGGQFNQGAPPVDPADPALRPCGEPEYQRWFRANAISKKKKKKEEILGLRGSGGGGPLRLRQAVMAVAVKRSFSSYT